jgi:pentatricopeptide repeat protein
MNGYCLVNQVSKALDILNTMADKGVAPNVRSYNIIINGLCKIKMVDEAMNLFEEMQSKKITPDTVTCNSLIDGLFKSGKTSFAWELVYEMHDRGQPANFTVCTYKIIINHLCFEGLLSEAIALLSRMKYNGCIPDIVTYGTIIGYLSK